MAKIDKGIAAAIPAIANDLAFTGLLEKAADKGAKGGGDLGAEGVLHTFTGRMKQSIHVVEGEAGAFDVIIDVPYAIDFENGNWRDEYLMVDGQLTPLGEWFKDPAILGWSAQKIRANRKMRVGHSHAFLTATIWREIDRLTDIVRECIVTELMRP